MDLHKTKHALSESLIHSVTLQLYNHSTYQIIQTYTDLFVKSFSKQKMTD